ncbi:MAG: hypothetical protein HY654_00625 [Acidobacteria bacterium]|nr:hypothetical protein [Acidobacteriota bacterium]
MTNQDDTPAKAAERAWRDLDEALGMVVFFAAGLERALCDTHWKLESEQLAHAARRATSAALALKACLPPSGR